LVRTIAGLAGTRGNADGDVGSATLNNPWDVLLRPDGSLLISSDNDALRELSADGRKIRTVGHIGRSLAMDPKSNIVYFATDYSVWQLAGGSSKATLLAGDIHVGGYVDGKGTNAKFKSVSAIAFDTTRQRLIVTDAGNNLIRTVSLDGTVSSLAGCASTTGDYMDGVATEAKFSAPSGLLCDPINVGDLFVADCCNHCVRLITSEAKDISKYCVQALCSRRIYGDYVPVTRAQKYTKRPPEFRKKGATTMAKSALQS